MSYIVIDLEWNQAMSAKSSVFNHLPIHLRGEIIQIGAVKLNDDFTPGEEFQCDVRPVWFRKMHHKVKKLTGFDNDRLAHGLPFPEAMEQFTAWCGPDCTFMTWGYDDRGIMEQNLIIHDLEIDWLGQWINLQLIYNQQTDGDRNQKSLETAMEHFGIEQTRVAHDALGDAYNTALVCSKLDLDEGVANYGHLVQQISHHAQPSGESSQGPAPLAQMVSENYYTREALWQAEEAAVVKCPVCGQVMERTHWLNQGDRRYMSLAHCEQDGDYLLRIRIRHEDNGSWHANHLLYQADEAMVAKFRDKQAHPKRRRRSRKKAAENTPEKT
jgi:inhibitor of KinA sporulation pathway (predicted exonuclease)